MSLMTESSALNRVTAEQLRHRVVDKLLDLGFCLDSRNQLFFTANNKDAIRRVHEPAKNIELERALPWLKDKLPKYRRFFANGNEIIPENIKPILIPVVENWHHELFRIARLYWSLPYSRGYGRRLRYLVLDDSNDKLIGIFALQSPPLSFPSRDKIFTYPDGQKTELVNQTMDIHTLGAVPPYARLLGYGSRPMLPMWFKHFATGANGAGEAYHIGIFGKTGSGKSVLAKMILMAYARHKNMGILVIDPQGEFAQDISGQGALGSFRLPLKEILNHHGKPSSVISVKNLVLDRWELFAQILCESRFFEQLSMPKGENRDLAANALKDNLPKRKVVLSQLYERSAFETAWKLLGDEKVQMTFYRSSDSRERFKIVYESADKNMFYNEHWLPVCQLFREDRQNAQKVEQILARLFDMEQQKRPIIVVDLSAETTDELFWNDTIKALVIKRLLEGIRYTAEKAYIKKENLNTLVLMDEAHRLAPAETSQNDYERQVRGIFIDAVRTTRKYGVGWMFISQTLSSLHREINQQLRIFFFGFGLGMGAEYQALGELVGGRSQALDLYKLFRDPHSAFDISSRAYSFMTIGPVSPLSFAGTPLFLSAFTKPEEFLRANALQIQQKLF
jgi:hypothetical protein